MAPELVLASGSPRRKDLLTSLGLDFRTVPADIDETIGAGEAAETHVLRLAREKAAVVAQRFPQALVLAADTIVVLDGEIFGKPRDRQDAREKLARLAGREHSVLTAVAFDGFARRAWMQRSRMRFRTLSSREIAWYVDTGEPDDKSGAYAFQGIGTFMVESVDGSPSNVLGLPLAETIVALREVGFPLPWE